MSKAEILSELPRLTREERREVVSKVHEIDGDDWLDEGELSDEAPFCKSLHTTV